MKEMEKRLNGEDMNSLNMVFLRVKQYLHCEPHEHQAPKRFWLGDFIPTHQVNSFTISTLSDKIPSHFIQLITNALRDPRDLHIIGRNNVEGRFGQSQLASFI